MTKSECGYFVIRHFEFVVKMEKRLRDGSCRREPMLAAACELILLGSGQPATIRAAIPCLPRLAMHIFKDHSALPAGAHAKSPSHAAFLVEADLPADVGTDAHRLPAVAQSDRDMALANDEFTGQ